MERKLIANHLVPDDEVWVSPATWERPFSLKAKESTVTDTQQLKAKIPQNIMERLEAVQCIVASPCDAEEAQCAWDELDSIIAELSAIWPTVGLNLSFLWRLYGASH